MTTIMIVNDEIYEHMAMFTSFKGTNAIQEKMKNAKRWVERRCAVRYMALRHRASRYHSADLSSLLAFSSKQKKIVSFPL